MGRFPVPRFPVPRIVVSDAISPVVVPFAPETENTMIDKAKVAADFKGQFSLGKVLAFAALTIVVGVGFYFLRKTPAKQVLDKIPGNPTA